MSQNADGTHGTGPNNSASAGDTASGNGAVNPADMERMINEAVSKALGARMRRLNLDEIVAKAIEQHMPAAQSQQPAALMPEQNDPEKLTVKSLDAQVKAQLKTLQDRLDASEKARAAAEAKAAQTRLQSDLRTSFVKHMGADNPHLDAYLNVYANKFQVREGQTYHVTQDAFGDEQIVPLDQAAESLFKGELKHLLPQKSSHLPPTSVARGMPMAAGQRQSPGILEREILHSMAQRDADSFEAIQPMLRPDKP
jgi:multidrug efflux pump subunit AcrA (membrane-fusion protein)